MQEDLHNPGKIKMRYLAYFWAAGRGMSGLAGYSFKLVMVVTSTPEGNDGYSNVIRRSLTKYLLIKCPPNKTPMLLIEFVYTNC